MQRALSVGSGRSNNGLMTVAPPRYLPHRPLPPYSYVTGLSPHPTSDPRGHSFGRHEQPAAPLEEATYRANETYLLGLDLFNHGFYWEAHEAWEALWHAAGQRGPVADFLKGLIKLAAAGVKAREGRVAGVRMHAQRAAELFRGLPQAQPPYCGLSPAVLSDAADHIAGEAEQFAGAGAPDATRRLTLSLWLAT
jgi:hypothetical protein